MKKIIPWLKKILLVLIVLVVAVAAVAAISAGIRSCSNSTEEVAIEESRALGTAELIVKAHLAAHSEATFCTADQAIITQDGNTWTISGWVDTTVASGEVTRNNYAVKFSYEGEDTFTLHSCNIF